MTIKIKKEMTSFIFILIGSLITIIAAFYEYKNKLVEKEEQIKTEVKRNEEYQNIIFSQRVVMDTSNRIIELQNELNEKNIKIQKLQDATLNYISGATKIPKLKITVDGLFIIMSMQNDDNLVIKNVSVNLERIIYDYYDLEGPASGYPNNQGAIKQFKLPPEDLEANKGGEIYKEKFNEELKNFSYKYNVKWENGSYSGEFHYKKTKESFDVESQITSPFINEFNLSHAVLINNVPSSVIKQKIR
jgi:hypothetical protein